MRGVLGFGLLMFVAACGSGLSPSKAQSLVQDHWHQEGGIQMRDLFYACSPADRGTTEESAACLAAAECLVPAALELSRGEFQDLTTEAGGRPNPLGPWLYEANARTVVDMFPAFTARSVKVLEVSDNVAEGLSAGQTAGGSAVFQVNLVPSRYAEAAADCPAFAAFFATIRQPTVMNASFDGRQVNRGSGLRIEWQLGGGVYAYDQEG